MWVRSAELTAKLATRRLVRQFGAQLKSHLVNNVRAYPYINMIDLINQNQLALQT